MKSVSIDFNRNSWGKALNLSSKLKYFCQRCTRSFSFWLLVALCTIAEPFLCTKRPVGTTLVAQVILLGVSTVLFFIQLIGVATREWDKIVMIEALTAFNRISLSKTVVTFAGRYNMPTPFNCRLSYLSFLLLLLLFIIFFLVF